MCLVTYEKNKTFAMDMFGFKGDSLDNELALENRFTLVLIKSGSGIVRINEKTYSFIAPVLMCINENEHITIDKSLGCEIDVIYFHPNIINYQFDFNNVRKLPEGCSITFEQDAYLCKYFIERDIKYKGIISLGPLMSNKCEKMFKAFRELSTLQENKFWPCRSRSNIIQILFLVDNIYNISENSEDNIFQEIDDEIAPIIVYLHNNYEKKITIKSLTSEFGINRTTLSEKFTKATGDTIINYLNKIRIRIAAILLRDTKIPIYEVMERSGFNDSAHFLRTFKKFTDFSPKGYREKYCWVD